MDISNIIRSELFLITLTFILYWIACALQRRTGLRLLNPMIVTIACLILFLSLTGIEYKDYAPGGRLIEFWLKPAIVALAMPLYDELRHIRSQLIPVILSGLAGCVTGIVSVVLVAKWLGATTDVILSLAPKSVSTPIALEISARIGGIPSLTGAIVVAVGMIGAVCGQHVMASTGVNTPVARSLGMGAAAHVIGTGSISQCSLRHGAYSTVALIINGILTAILADPLTRLLL